MKGALKARMMTKFKASNLKKMMLLRLRIFNFHSVKTFTSSKFHPGFDGMLKKCPPHHYLHVFSIFWFCINNRTKYSFQHMFCNLTELHDSTGNTNVMAVFFLVLGTGHRVVMALKNANFPDHRIMASHANGPIVNQLRILWFKAAFFSNPKSNPF